MDREVGEWVVCVGGVYLCGKKGDWEAVSGCVRGWMERRM